MARILGGILCEELTADYDEGADQSGVGGRKGYLCNWDDRFTVARALLGLSSAPTVYGAITITTPSPHPQLYNSFCTAVALQGVGRPFQGTYQIAYPKCKVLATYGAFAFNMGPWNQNIDPATPLIYAEQEIDVGVEVVTVPGQALRFSGGVTRLDQDFGHRIALVDFKITLHRVPYLPGQKILETAGRINIATYLGVAAGYLLYNGAHNVGKLLADGTYTQDITYSFTARGQPWDYAYNATASAWQKVVKSNGSDFITRQSFVGLFPDEYS